MLAPNAMNIEQATQEVILLSTHLLERQLKELAVAVGETTKEYQDGYTLGLQTARVMIASGLTNF